MDESWIRMHSESGSLYWFDDFGRVDNEDECLLYNEETMNMRVNTKLGKK